MATKTFTQLTAETSLAAADEFPFWDASAAAARKVTLTNLFGAIPVAVAMTSPAAGTTALSVDTASSPSASVALLKIATVTQYDFGVADSTGRRLSMAGADLGSNRGREVFIGNNNNGSTPAAGHLQMQNLGSTGHYVWPDTAGNLRIGTTVPTNANDTSGTVVGTQTSWHALKEDVVEWDGAEALAAIQALTLYSYRMVEDGQKTPDGDKPTYYGLVIQEEDRDNNAWFALGLAENQVPVLNDRTIFGYLLAAVRQGANIIGELQARVAVLEGAGQPGV